MYKVTVTPNLDIDANEVAFVEVLNEKGLPETPPNFELEVSVMGQTDVKPWRVSFEKTSNPWWKDQENGGLAEVMIGNDDGNIFGIAVVNAATGDVISALAVVPTTPWGQKDSPERFHRCARVVFSPNGTFGSDDEMLRATLRAVATELADLQEKIAAALE